MLVSVLQILINVIQLLLDVDRLIDDENTVRQVIEKRRTERFGKRQQEFPPGERFTLVITATRSLQTATQRLKHLLKGLH